MNKTEKNILLEKIIKYSKNSHPKHNWEGHILPVVDVSLRLADKYGGDRFVIEAGAFMHDIGRVLVDENRFYKYIRLFGLSHEKTGYYITDYKLKKLNIDDEFKKKISRCVLEHSGSSFSRFTPTSLESEIVMNADSIVSFEQYFYLFSISYASKGKNIGFTKKWLLEKLKNSYEKKLTLEGLKLELMPSYKKIRRYIENIDNEQLVHENFNNFLLLFAKRYSNNGLDIFEAKNYLLNMVNAEKIRNKNGNPYMDMIESGLSYIKELK